MLNDRDGEGSPRPARARCEGADRRAKTNFLTLKGAQTKTTIKIG